MSLQIARRSASLVILSQNLTKSSNQFDYKILLAQRGKKLSFSNYYVFPGGVQDKKDLKMVKSNQTTNESQSLLDLQYTALRETFEETGLYIDNCNIHQSDSDSELMKIIQKYTKQPHFVDIHSELIKNQQLEPQFLMPIFHVITPQIPGIKRYDTQFFIHQINQQNTFNLGQFLHTQEKKDLHQFEQLQIDQKETVAYDWFTPIEALNCYNQKKINLMPPQIIILQVLAGFERSIEVFNYLQDVQKEATLLRKTNIQNALLCDPLVFPYIFVNKKTKTQTINGGLDMIFYQLPGDQEFPLQQIIKKEEQTNNQELADYLAEKYSNLKIQFSNDDDGNMQMKPYNFRLASDLNSLENPYLGRKIFLENMQQNLNQRGDMLLPFQRSVKENEKPKL